MHIRPNLEYIHKQILHIVHVIHFAPVITLDGFGGWDSRGCRVISDSAEATQCGCDHFTHFAILLVRPATINSNKSCLNYIHQPILYMSHFYVSCTHSLRILSQTQTLQWILPLLGYLTLVLLYLSLALSSSLSPTLEYSELLNLDAGSITVYGAPTYIYLPQFTLEHCLL